ncbi:hypothetical protein FJT64_018680 [Amphibalanus amphitrite]|uniref:Uncharacterized protein n=1 Tax=Amphibalanus amphitrite TaxID=1232801 RepID=A0A6A4WTY8_AMPAM|nr:hypothetical protein FJT64_018680 [Amphibalanus amphitrite]
MWNAGRWRQLIVAAAVTVVLCLVLTHRLSSGSARPADRAVPPPGPVACSALSIVCAADGPAQIPGAGDSQEAVLEALRSSHQHVVLAGHSRMRQVFEELPAVLGAELRTRADRPPPLPDSDDPRAPALATNDTCLAALPKTGWQPSNFWCSLAADWERVLFDFRWRHLTRALAELLERLAARPPHRLVIAHGLYQDGSTNSTVQLRADLRPLMAQLRQLQRRGTSVAWMLEAAKNGYTRYLGPASGHGLVVTNALLAETVLEAGVPLWSSHLPVVQHWLLSRCRRPQPGADNSVCEQQQLHTDPATNALMVSQLLEALTEREWSVS